MSGLDGQKSQDVHIDKSPLLNAVFKANEADKKKKSDEIIGQTRENYEHVVEVEHRFLPSDKDGILDEKGNLDHELVMKLPGAYMRRIEQAYVDAVIPGTKETERFRLRRTTRYGPKGVVVSREFRVALKNKLVDNPNARVETQVIMHPSDPGDEEKVREFEKLWKGKKAFSFDRYYVRHELPIPDEFYVENGYTVPRANDRYCEIHIERRHAPPPELEGMVRIEIEYLRTADERYVNKHMKKVLPHWIGPDVTAQDGFSSKRLFAKGPPKEYEEHMSEVKAGRKARAKALRRQEEKLRKKEERRRKKEQKEKKKKKDKKSRD